MSLPPTRRKGGARPPAVPDRLKGGKRPPLAVPLPDAAGELGVTTRYIHGLLRRGELKGLKLGQRTFVIFRDSLDALRAKWERAAK